MIPWSRIPSSSVIFGGVAAWHGWEPLMYYGLVSSLCGEMSFGIFALQYWVRFPLLVLSASCLYAMLAWAKFKPKINWLRAYLLTTWIHYALCWRLCLKLWHIIKYGLHVNSSYKTFVYLFYYFSIEIIYTSGSQPFYTKYHLRKTSVSKYHNVNTDKQ